MAFTVEDGTGKPDANSYTDVNEADGETRCRVSLKSTARLSTLRHELRHCDVGQYH